MVKFITDFYRHSGWLGVVQRNATTGLLESGGTAITGIASYTYAQFAAFTDGEKAALAGIPIHINDLHQSSDGIGGSYVVRDASPAGWAQVSGPMYYATFDLVPAAGSYPGWRYRVGSGIGIGGADIYDTGTRLRYVDAKPVTVKFETTAVTKSTNMATEEGLASYLIPRNNGKSLLQNGDIIRLTQHASKSAGAAATFGRAFRIGINGPGVSILSDTVLDSVVTGGATTVSADEIHEFRRISATSIKKMGTAQSVSNAGFTTSSRAGTASPASLDAASTYFTSTYWTGTETAETITLEDWRLDIIHAGA